MIGRAVKVMRIATDEEEGGREPIASAMEDVVALVDARAEAPKAQISN